ncbi:hypothetical protein ACF0A6_03735 [Acinetobacter baumannii]|uniref:hypothetical protein n=1 Tax=Acinetobacter baumannii TaxID=470 RepID=UPI001BCA8270|nr:hypothetical protein [Acinetobacter baumannii]MDQ7845072.1 hypothetical protein [Acinetobacter baumannii]
MKETTSQNKKLRLIKGEVALIHVHKGVVQHKHDDEPYGRWTTITDNLWSQYHLGMFLDPKTKFKFRFKPKTIVINGIEVPAPEEPKMGEWFYFLSTEFEEGYSSRRMQDDTPEYLYQYGAWLDEFDIQEVVKAYRSFVQETVNA